MLDDPKVIAAIVAGVVSLIVSATSGLYILVQNKKRLEILKNELLIKASTESFLKAKEAYLDFFREFESELFSINKKNPNDSSEALQFAIDFYGKRARDFYLRNKLFLQTTELNDLFDKISLTIKLGNWMDAKNHSVKREFGNNILRFCNELHDQALVIN